VTDYAGWAKRKNSGRRFATRAGVGLIPVEVDIHTATGVHRAIRYHRVEDAKKMIAEGKAKEIKEMKPTGENDGVKRVIIGTGAGRVTQLRCKECDRWVNNNLQFIRHSKSCESKAQPTPPASIVKDTTAHMQGKQPLSDKAVRWMAKNGAASAVGDEKRIRDMVSRGMLSESDAMNRDF
jgi:hypothetical protein